MIERIPTGVPGLDDRIQGGFPKGKSLLVTGNAGAGKTIFALHVTKRACEEGRKCLYIATEETPEDIKTQAETFGWDLSQYEETGLLKIERVLEKLVRANDESLPRAIRSRNRRRSLIELAGEIEEEYDLILVDNAGVFFIGYSAEELRSQLDTFVYATTQKGSTTLLVCDEAVNKATNDVSLYSVYGVIRLRKEYNTYMDEWQRVMDITKMRATAIPSYPIPFKITGTGIEFVEDSAGIRGGGGDKSGSALDMDLNG